jgi:hypothetical protein
MIDASIRLELKTTFETTGSWLARERFLQVTVILDVRYTRLPPDPPNPGFLISSGWSSSRLLGDGVVAVHYPDAGIVRDHGAS